MTMAGKALFTFGDDFSAPALTLLCSTAAAIANATDLKGTGAVWRRYRGHHYIVGNYAHGRVYNGQAQCVDATAADWDWLAAHAN